MKHTDTVQVERAIRCGNRPFKVVVATSDNISAGVAPIWVFTDIPITDISVTKITDADTETNLC